MVASSKLAKKRQAQEEAWTTAHTLRRPWEAEEQRVLTLQTDIAELEVTVRELHREVQPG